MAPEYSDGELLDEGATNDTDVYLTAPDGGSPSRSGHGNSISNAHGHLHRGLSARQVQMIAIAGTIGTGLFLGTGKALATGGPASMLIGYGVIAFVVYITLLLLGEMATQYPVAGKHGDS